MLPVLGVISTPAGEDEGAGEGENGEAKTTLQLDVLKLFAEMSSFCGELDKAEHYTQIVFNTLLVGGASCTSSHILFLIGQFTFTYYLLTTFGWDRSCAKFLDITLTLLL